MRLFKCLVPVLVLLLVGGSSATLCFIHQFLIFHNSNSILHRLCDFKEDQQDPPSVPPNVNSRINIYNEGAIQQNDNENATAIGIMYRGPPGQWQDRTSYTLSGVAGSESTANPFPSQGAVPQQSGPPGKWVFVPFEATNAGGGTGPSGFGGSGSAYSSRAPGENFASIAYVNAGSNGVGGFGGNAGSTGSMSGGTASSGSGPGGYGGSNGVSFGANAKADAVPTAGASSGSRTDGFDGASAYQQDIVSPETLASLIVEVMKSNQGHTPISPELPRAISNANLNASGGSASSSSKSIANGSGNATAQATSSAISTGGRSSASSYASTSADTNV